MIIELNKDGENGLEKRYFKNKAFSHVTGNQIKLLPFKTNPSGDSFSDDFKSFQGVIGELFRILNSKNQVANGKNNSLSKLDLKEKIIEAALKKVVTEHKAEFENVLNKLFFNEDHGLIKFNIKTLSYMNFINTNNAIKEVSKFIFDIYLADINNDLIIREDADNENLLHQLVIKCLPQLSDINTKSKITGYFNLFHEIKEQFDRDFKFLSSNNNLFLKHIEDFFKYYYFHYLNQLILDLKDFGRGTAKVKPIHYTMDWETLSETRLSSQGIGWKQLNKCSESVFAHVNTLELLNYILVDGNSLKDYRKIFEKISTFNNEEKENFQQCLDELINFYSKSISGLDTGKSWEDCDRLLELSLVNEIFNDNIHKSIYILWFRIKYQFENSSRSKPYSNYSKWYTHFGKVNYTKQRGRLGNTMVLSQELLLFLTRICIGLEDKIRLKTLWERFKDRGIVFDESSKLEITKLFEKINLIEKKSDSGDAQYVKSTI